MFNKIVLTACLVGSVVFGQKTEFERNNIQGQPKKIEESNTKALIRVSQIVDYDMEYHTKTTFNQQGNPILRVFFSDSGNELYTETYAYNDANKLILKTLVNENEGLNIVEDYVYTDTGYVVTKSENELIVLITSFELDKQQQIVREIAKNQLEENIFIDKTNVYKNNKLTKTIVKHDGGLYELDFKTDDNGNVIEEVFFTNGKKIGHKKTRKFDQQNNLVEEKLFGDDGGLKHTSKFMYAYDSHNNWTKRTQYSNQFDQPLSNTTRTLSY